MLKQNIYPTVSWNKRKMKNYKHTQLRMQSRKMQLIKELNMLVNQKHEIIINIGTDRIIFFFY